MRTCAIALLAALGAAALAQTATTITAPNGSRFVINSGSYTGAPTSIQGSANFFTSNIASDFNFRYAFAYRQTGDTREYAVSATTGATFSSTADSWTGVIPRNVLNTGPNTLEFTVDHRIVDLDAVNPLLVTRVTVRNLTVDARGVVLFHYSDFDVPGPAGGGPGDSIVSNLVNATGITTRQREGGELGSFAETIAFGAERFRHGPLYATLFSNTVIDNLDNTTPLPTATGDFGMGMQWAERTLQGGESTTYTVMTSLNAPVPEPATLIALGLGAAALLRRRRKSA
jgi:hypothetical protein